MRFNHLKCKVLSVYNTLDRTQTTYTMGENQLQNTDQMEDLGIILTSDLKWNGHIAKFKKKAEKTLWLILRTLSYQAPVKAKLTTYLAMIRSIIEYGSCVWSPGLKEQLRTIEKVQQKSTNFILSNAPYYSPQHIDYKT